MSAVLQEPAIELMQRYRRLQQERPQLRVRDAASELGVSEAELVAAEGATPLAPDWAALLAELPRLGRVMCLTRNEACVHERQGCFESVEVNGGMGLVLGPDIDLRLFLRRWAQGYACTQTLHSGVRKSLQFFDAQGVAIQKIYLTDASQDAVFDEMVAKYQQPGRRVEIQPAFVPPSNLPDDEIDVRGLLEAWQGMRDTHDFYGMLARFKVGRVQALRLAGAPLGRTVPADSAKQMLEAASAAQEPIMCFVSNRGCIQIHTGEVHKIARKGPWLNILDEAFNLHLREDLVTQSWVVRKPTEDGVVTALELYDAHQELVVQFFGKRKPGQAEREGWRDIIARIEAQA